MEYSLADLDNGSEYADAALDDLRPAGPPRDAEALIISAAEG
jgi:hypothetical protein